MNWAVGRDKIKDNELVTGVVRGLRLNRYKERSMKTVKKPSIGNCIPRIMKNKIPSRDISIID